MAEVQLRSHQSKVYHQLAGCYEMLFARFFQNRILQTIDTLRMPPGAKVLEVGVGTGLSFDAYPEHAHVTAIDLSNEMLDRAQKKLDAMNSSHIELRQMDALKLEFPDEHFDYVMSFHVISVVPDHQRMVQEMVRVAKPNATIVIINHFRSPSPWVASVVDRLDPVTRRLGWRTTLRLEDVVSSGPLKVERVYKTSRRSLFTVVHANKGCEHKQFQRDGKIVSTPALHGVCQTN